jgi:hypothetical protein
MKNLLLFASLLVASVTASAATFQGNTSGTFENPTGPSGMVTTGVGTDSFTWGQGTTKYLQGTTKYLLGFIPVGQNAPSSLTYSDTNFNANVDQTFTAGYLNFYNGTIYSGTQANSVDLSLTLNFTSPSAFTETFSYGFSLENVVNPTGDTTTFLSSMPTKFYSYAGTDYYFELLGFSKNGVDLLDHIFLEEGKKGKVKLLGQFTAMPSEVPLPAAVWLFGSGLMGFMAMRKRAKAQA